MRRGCERKCEYCCVKQLFSSKIMFHFGSLWNTFPFSFIRNDYSNISFLFWVFFLPFQFKYIYTRTAAQRTLRQQPTFFPKNSLEFEFVKCEFCENWDFENVNFAKNEILWKKKIVCNLKMSILWTLRFSKCDFWKICGFLPRCALSQRERSEFAV